MENNNPLISVITATFNAEKYLSFLLQSLTNQTFKNFELVIQDGASSDGTMAVLEKYSDKLQIKIKSEKDYGIYDAWNRAAERAKGEWLIFLGADDSLISNSSFLDVAEILKIQPDNIEFVASAMEVDNVGVETYYVKPHPDFYNALVKHVDLSPFPALLIKRSVVVKHKFDIKFKISGDYDFLTRAVKPDNFVNTDLVLTYMLYGGVSNTFSKRYAVIKEIVETMQSRNYPYSWFNYKYRLFKGALVSFTAKMLGEKNTYRLIKIFKSFKS